MLSWAVVLLLGQAHPHPDHPPLTTDEQAKIFRENYAWLLKSPLAHDDGGIMARIREGDLSDTIQMLSTAQDLDGGIPGLKYVWKVPELQYYIDVPTVQVVNGLPVRFSAAVSKAKPDFLLKYYIAEFDKAGLWIPPADQQLELREPSIQVTALDTDFLISYTVMLQVVDDTHTTVIMSQGYLMQWLQKKKGAAASEVDFAPLFPQADRVVRTHTEGVDMIQFTSSSEAGAIESFYREVFKKSGYREREKGLFAKGIESIKLDATRRPGRKETGVLLQRRLMSAPTDAPPPAARQ